MERSKRVIFISHCILNQNTVVPPLARAKGPYRDIIEEIMKHDIGIHQMPCPEYRYLGLKRKPMTKSEYDTESFRNLCRKISEDIVNIMEEYLSNDYKIVGLIGINHSPSCSIIGNRGVLMEELMDLVYKSGIKLSLIDVPTYYHDGDKGKEFIVELKAFLNS